MKVLVLLSGGFDSAVAAKVMIDREYGLEAVHFSAEPFTDDQPERKARKVAEKLGMKIHVVNIGKDLEKIAKETKRNLYFVLMKRLMYKKAEQLAKKLKCDALVTGEALAQVSSQTLDNLYVINKSVKIPVIRPLIGLNKQDIINKSKSFGLYDVTVGPEQCDVLGPKHPSTTSRAEEVELEEEKVF